MPVERISNDERSEAISSAIEIAQSVIGTETGCVHPNARVGQLSPFEWMKIAEGCVSGWIGARSRQLVGERFWDEDLFLATGEVPEQAELGLCSHALPALGDLCEKLGITDKPIGEWSKDQVLLFVWTAADLVQTLKTHKCERPGELTNEQIMLMGA